MRIWTRGYRLLLEQAQIGLSWVFPQHILPHVWDHKVVWKKDVDSRDPNFLAY